MTQEHIKVFSGSPVIVKRLKSILEEHGIQSIYKNQDESARISGFGGPLNFAELFILNTDYDKAEELVKNYQKEIDA
ncbi:MAG: DUF2007 domain-containing protein [Flavobacteriaceae bacterium]|nr:DUF2007 domain-containing protein [Flavobacteriaceae bacterium]